MNVIGLAFVFDPDGYWVELVKRGENSGIPNEYNFSQTMLRVKDPKKSIAFYQKLGMKVVEDRHFAEAKFSLYFLASSTVPEGANLKTMFAPVLELTHNHGTEDEESFQHYNGNEDGRQGFGHIGFLVDDVYKACDGIRPMGYGFRKVSKHPILCPPIPCVPLFLTISPRTGAGWRVHERIGVRIRSGVSLSSASKVVLVYVLDNYPRPRTHPILSYTQRVLG
jgi:lactoylglutathione lyase